jgi:ABC-type Co2+ transport system permease subunit
MINFEFKNPDWDSILITILLFIVALFINAWIITVCWNEYLMQVVGGLHEISMMQAIALRILVSTLTSSLQIGANDK